MPPYPEHTVGRHHLLGGIMTGGIMTGGVMTGGIMTRHPGPPPGEVRIPLQGVGCRVHIIWRAQPIEHVVGAEVDQSCSWFRVRVTVRVRVEESVLRSWMLSATKAAFEFIRSSLAVRSGDAS